MFGKKYTFLEMGVFGVEHTSRIRYSMAYEFSYAHRWSLCSDKQCQVGWKLASTKVCAFIKMEKLSN